MSDVTYYDFQGTCSGDKAISLNCGSLGCSNLTMKKINITSVDPTRKVGAVCTNAHGTNSDTIPYVDCLSTKRLIL